MPQLMDHGRPVDPERQCEARVKGSYHRRKKPAIVDRHFCAYHSGLAGPRFDALRDVDEEAQGPCGAAQVGEEKTSLKESDVPAIEAEQRR